MEENRESRDGSMEYNTSSHFRPAQRKGRLRPGFVVHLSPVGLLWAFSEEDFDETTQLSHDLVFHLIQESAQIKSLADM